MENTERLPASAELEKLILGKDAETVERFVEALSPDEAARTVSRVDGEVTE